MKKVLTIFSLLAVLGMSVPAFAAPPPARGPHEGHAGTMQAAPMHAHHAAPPPPRRGHYGAPPHHRNNVIIGGVLARRGYWDDPFYGNRIICSSGYYYDPFYDYPICRPYPRTHYNSGIYVNVGFPIRF